VEIPSVRAELLPGAIGYISISEFKGNTGEQLIRTLETSKMRNMLALILDLRSSAGGSVEAAQQVVSQFLPPGGLFVYEIDQGGKRRDWPILEEGLAVKALPMVVLVNEDTLGVAEAVAGALQEAGRAALMGTRTAGKGSINTLVKLTDGSAIYLPTSRWYSPSGRLLEGTGITPDAWVPLQPEDRGFGRERQFNQAYEYLNSRLPPFR
jgi:carboxyl-terminal processing protease